MATGGTQAISGSASGTNSTTIFSSETDGGAPATIGVSNRSTSAGPVYVFADTLHDNGEPMTLQPGDKWPFRVLRSGGVVTVKVKGDGENAATVDFGVIAR